MGVALTTAPAQIMFSKNPINLVLTSDDFVAVIGFKSVTKVTFTGPVVADNTFRLLWANADLTLTAADAPDDSGIQFPTGAGDEAYVRLVMAALVENPYIDADFDLAYALDAGHPSITITAKKTGAIYNITEIIGAPINVDASIAGVNMEIKPNFYHHLEVWLKVAGVFINVYSENIALDSPIDGKSTKDIAEILNAYLEENSDRPDLAAATWQQCNNTLLEYYVKYGQFYGDSPTIKKLTKTGSYFVNLGGLSINAALNQTLSAFVRPGGVNNETLCLFQGSKVKTIQPDQPEFLYWLNLTGASADVKLRFEIFFVGGGSNAYTRSTQTIAAYQKYYIGVGYNLLNIMAALPSGKQCLYYTCAVVEATSGLYMSAVYTYVPDKYREWPRYFIFLNSLGGYQTIYTYGQAAPQVDRTKEDVKKQVTYSVAAVSGNLFENNIRIQDKTTINTGYNSKRDINLLKDFFASIEKYIFYQGRLIPIGITTDSLKLPQDGENISAAAFEFYPLYDEVVFTDDPTLADNTAAGTGGGFGPSGINFVMDDGNNDDDIYYDDI